MRGLEGTIMFIEFCLMNLEKLSVLSENRTRV